MITSITFPKAEEVMVAAAGSNVESYTIQDVVLRMEIISCMALNDAEKEQGGICWFPPFSCLPSSSKGPCWLRQSTLSETFSFA
mgnify:CR=1 FL=1